MALAPFAREPIVQTPAPTVPMVAELETKVNPDGRLFVTSTPVALPGPLFLATIVKVIFEPTSGVRLSTVSVTIRSTSGETALFWQENNNMKVAQKRKKKILFFIGVDF